MPGYAMYKLVAGLLLGMLVTACGQKGPLYLPESPPATRGTPCDAPQADCLNQAASRDADTLATPRQTLTLDPETLTPRKMP